VRFESTKKTHKGAFCGRAKWKREGRSPERPLGKNRVAGEGGASTSPAIGGRKKKRAGGGGGVSRKGDLGSSRKVDLGAVYLLQVEKKFRGGT